MSYQNEDWSCTRPAKPPFCMTPRAEYNLKRKRKKKKRNQNKVRFNYRKCFWCGLGKGIIMVWVGKLRGMSWGWVYGLNNRIPLPLSLQSIPPMPHFRYLKQTLLQSTSLQLVSFPKTSLGMTMMADVLSNVIAM